MIICLAICYTTYFTAVVGKDAGHPSHDIGKTHHDPLNVQKGPVGKSKILSHAKEVCSYVNNVAIAGIFKRFNF